MKFENEEINRLNEEYSSNNDNEKKLINENYSLVEAKMILESHEKNIDDISEIIEKNKSEIHHINEKRKKLRNQMIEIRKTCKHNWKDNGWDSHHNYYICTICGEEMRD